MTMLMSLPSPQAISTFLCFVVYIAIVHAFNRAPISLFDPDPHFAAVNHNNEIIVTDFHNHSVKVRPSHQLQIICTLVKKVCIFSHKMFVYLSEKLI